MKMRPWRAFGTKSSPGRLQGAQPISPYCTFSDFLKYYLGLWDHFQRPGKSRIAPKSYLSCLRQYTRSGPRTIVCFAKVRVHTVICSGLASSGAEKTCILIGSCRKILDVYKNFMEISSRYKNDAGELQSEKMVGKSAPNGTKREPGESQGQPKGNQRAPKGSQKRAKGQPEFI